MSGPVRKTCEGCPDNGKPYCSQPECMGSEPTPDEKLMAMEAAHTRASGVFHDHPSNPSSCELYEVHHRQRCVCEQDWRAHLPESMRVLVGGVWKATWETGGW